ncbi:protein neprosin-like isoform X1 [Lycium ferocissimum]|uniref:protein neprosin-like isoform X1 n=1 Tax=Lycium ferocissimum TaxID=112874 RepID=UPI0028160179|nr:protein neprosin-like isoform X1 [Lycium ferocissimum]
MKTKQKMSLHLRVIMQILVTISLFLNHYEVEGEQRLSKAEDLELEKQLKLLNKPAIKTIKGKYGEIYDCVDFYKQPAFDHPLLKNHNFHPQMKPTFFNLQRDDISSKMNRPFNIGLEGGGCPTGTVPIRRITKEDLIRRRLASQIRDADDSPDGDGIESNVSDGTKHPKGFGGGYKFATVQIPYKLRIKMAGVGAIISLHNPQHLSGHEHSGGRIKVQKGIDSIQVGWTVSPPVYGDTHTRSYIYFKAGKLACYNTQCPGFVHINTAIPLDGELPGSSYGGPIYDLPMEIARDIPSGNWWFHLGIGSKFTPIGFWPAKIFTSLKGFATSAEFGGVVYSPPGVREPSMGSGYFPVGDLKKDAYCRKSTYFTDKRQSKSLDEISVKSFASSPNLYRVTDYPNAGGGNGNIVFYGGPGEHI